ncbi:hypothetical protein RRF57_011592 [Xylaria bambusicola]|uniref:Uncharacterized protein n=1 Tax=Xylaria bambusicola TaxID=326684 RepID=A0AAN7UN34_9PEZI
MKRTTYVILRAALSFVICCASALSFHLYVINSGETTSQVRDGRVARSLAENGTSVPIRPFWICQVFESNETGNGACKVVFIEEVIQFEVEDIALCQANGMRRSSGNGDIKARHENEEPGSEERGYHNQHLTHIAMLETQENAMRGESVDQVEKQRSGSRSAASV